MSTDQNQNPQVQNPGNRPVDDPGQKHSRQAPGQQPGDPSRQNDPSRPDDPSRQNDPHRSSDPDGQNDSSRLNDSAQREAGKAGAPQPSRDR
jgi:hypothetical protein